MTKSIDLKFLTTVLKKAWWKIAIFTVIVTILIGVLSTLLVPKKYASSVEMMVNNVSITTEYTTSALTAATEYLVNDYIRIISGDDMVKMVKEYISDPNRDKTGDYANITEAQIRNMISSHPSDGSSSMFTVSVTAESDPNLAYYVAECISLNAPDIIKKLYRPIEESPDIFQRVLVSSDGEGKDNYEYKKITLDLECVTVICAPTLATQPTSSSMFKHVAIAALSSAAVSYAFFAVLGLVKLSKKDKDAISADIPEAPSEQ